MYYCVWIVLVSKIGGLWYRRAEEVAELGGGFIRHIEAGTQVQRLDHLKSVPFLHLTIKEQIYLVPNYSYMVTIYRVWNAQLGLTMSTGLIERSEIDKWEGAEGTTYTGRFCTGMASVHRL